jgi:hypothetical protein
VTNSHINRYFSVGEREEEERKENTKKGGREDAAFSVEGRNALIKIPICL